MTTIKEKVTEFHRIFGQPILTTPTKIDHNRIRMRLRLIAEEFLELLDAVGADGEDLESANYYIDAAIDDAHINDQFYMVDVADALGDIAYVVEGMNLELGIDSEAVLDEIHRSNCSKLGSDGKPVYRPDGKVTKGANYSPPDIAGVLAR